MASVYGYYQLEDLVQTYSLNDKKFYGIKQQSYPKNSVSWFLSTNKEYSYYFYMLKLVGRDEAAGDILFNNTLFVASNKDLEAKGYNEAFFMNLDKNSAMRLIKYSTLIRRVGLASLNTRRASKLDTLDRENNINFLNISPNGQMYVDNSKILGEVICSNGNIILIDGLLRTQN